MPALVGKDIELPAGSPRRRNDMTGSQPGAAAQDLVDSVRVYASLGFERRGDLCVAVTRLLTSRLALGGRWCPGCGFGHLGGDNPWLLTE
jgi:hypothetical protein